jgi:RHS repeat-associated protein
VVIDHPFPGYEVENPTGSATVRLTFSIAGQAVALKVMTGSSTATYYLYNDHLGSVAAMSTNGGGTVNGSTARYYPFGAWRTEPTAGLTDRGFTGHLHNNLGSGADNLGLVYMQARWYLPALGRFISADTLVPDPTNPQSYNRYSYVENRPLVAVDPTGHWLESAWDAFNVGLGLHSLYNNVRDGNYGWAAADAVGVVVDAAALVLPVVPGGVGTVIKAARGVDTAVDAIQTVNQVSNAAQAANHAANVDQSAQTVTRYTDEAIQVTPVDLFAFGGGPSGARPHPNPRIGRDIFPDPRGMLSPQSLPLPQGQSTFANVAESGLTGPYYRLPAGTQLPSGLSVVADGKDMYARSPHPNTHHTIYNTVSMHADEFVEHIRTLGWQFHGKR